MTGKYLAPAGPKLDQSLSTRPSVLPAPHRVISEVGLTIGSGSEQDLLLYGHGSLEQLGVTVGETDPLRLSLVEAEVTARPRAPRTRCRM